MLKRKICEAKFRWELKCQGPLLVADGRYSKKEVVTLFGTEGSSGLYPDKFFVNKAEPTEMIARIGQAGCSQEGYDWRFYVPATSIRGPFRALSERIIRSLLPDHVFPPLTVCDPFEKNEKEHGESLSCSKQLERVGDNESKYAAACPTCKLFGCAGLSSRIRFTDADIREYHSCYRDMIGIDRFTGGVHQSPEGGANMRFHVLENTTFTTEVTVTNFELWQLGLLAYVFRDFRQGLVPIGFGKTKGFGNVKGDVQEVTLVYPRECNHIEHMGSLMESATERSYYSIEFCEAPDFPHFDPVEDDFSLFHRFKVTDIFAFWESVAPAFNGYLEQLRNKAEEASQ